MTTTPPPLSDMRADRPKDLRLDDAHPLDDGPRIATVLGGEVSDPALLSGHVRQLSVNVAELSRLIRDQMMVSVERATTAAMDCRAEVATAVVEIHAVAGRVDRAVGEIRAVGESVVRLVKRVDHIEASLVARVDALELRVAALDAPKVKARRGTKVATRQARRT